MLVANKDKFTQANSEAEYFLRNLELIGIAQPPNALHGTEAWTINESNLMSLTQNPHSYLAPLLCDSTGDWNLAKVLPSGRSILSHLSSRLPNTEFFSDPAHPRFGQLQVNIPIRSMIDGAYFYIHPHGFWRSMLNTPRNQIFPRTLAWISLVMIIIFY